MIHYSCDRCKRSLEADELRYLIRIEAQAIIESHEADELDDERDHLLEIHEILERMNEDETEFTDASLYQKRRHDLCPECFRKYMKNPVGGDVPVQLGFSKN